MKIFWQNKSVNIDRACVAPLCNVFQYLDKQFGIEITVDDEVVITAYQCPYTDKLSACTLSVDGGVLINLPGGRSR
jgi:hypothetical protein